MHRSPSISSDKLVAGARFELEATEIKESGSGDPGLWIGCSFAQDAILDI
jgi:hypothetical protein